VDRTGKFEDRSEIKSIGIRVYNHVSPCRNSKFKSVTCKLFGYLHKVKWPTNHGGSCQNKTSRGTMSHDVAVDHATGHIEHVRF
jgi:hypothetical protein